MTAGIEIAACDHILSPENFEPLVAANARYTFIDLQNNVLIIALFSLVEAEHLHARYTCHFSLVLLIVAPVNGDKVVQAFEPRQSHHGGKLAHLAVNANVDDVVVTRK